jgi:sigma-B regulation protein RsbU (phosphoserine phosphatase)
LFTDGLYEVDNHHQEEYGQERLLAAVRKNLRLPTEPMLEALLKDVKGFCAATEFDDDVCLVAMEVQRLGVSG